MEMFHVRILIEYKQRLKIEAATRRISMTRLMGEILDEYFGKTRGITK